MPGKRTEAKRAGINPTIVITSGRRVYSLPRLGSTQLPAQRRRQRLLPWAGPAPFRCGRCPRAPLARPSHGFSRCPGEPRRVCRREVDLVLREPRARACAVHSPGRGFPCEAPPAGSRAHLPRPPLHAVGQRGPRRLRRPHAGRCRVCCRRRFSPARRGKCRLGAGGKPGRHRGTALRARLRAGRSGPRQRRELVDRSGWPGPGSPGTAGRRGARKAAARSVGVGCPGGPSRRGPAIRPPLTPVSAGAEGRPPSRRKNLAREARCPRRPAGRGHPTRVSPAGAHSTETGASPGDATRVVGENQGTRSYDAAGGIGEKA